ncbi:MAG: TrkH family potassium uptake protein [Boseongicola sp.]|nr:MAG: TrkH family potassium uptake protein [Boseongicola sp.]
MARLRSLPLFVVLMGIGAAIMLIPAIHAYSTRDLNSARAFLYSAVLFLLLFTMLVLTTSNLRIRRQGRSHLISMFAFFAILPVMFAVPFYEAVPDTRFINAYVEMVSSITTTGLTLFDAERLPDTLHLWRAMVGWLGGLFIWVTAVAILAPLNLGGFEVISADSARVEADSVMMTQSTDPADRLVRFTVRLAPIYAGLTLVLWVALILAGETPLVGVIHAMSTMATSGITSGVGPDQAASGIGGEFLIFLFLIFALSRATFSGEDVAIGGRAIADDPEVRLGLILIVALPILLFLRHWIVILEDETVVTITEGLRSIWGSIFMVASFLTTTGFESAYWESARAWSGLQSPGILLLGLAILGGGVATTAGGVKLLRVYALYKHGVREMDKLSFPSSVARTGSTQRRFRRHGAYIAWIFFMLFAISIAGVSALFAFVGFDFEASLILAISTLSTTGPLLNVAGAEPITLGQLSDATKYIASASMVLGRLETLAIIALLNPDFWR